MTGKRAAWMAVLPCLLVIAGCRAEDDIRARYEYERLAWKVERYHQALHRSYIVSETRDRQLSIGLYEAFVSRDPRAREDTTRWDPTILRDIDRLVVSAEVLLAGLYLDQLQSEASGLYFRPSVDNDVGWDHSPWNVELRLCRALYVAGASEPEADRCLSILRKIFSDDGFWRGTPPPESDRLLDIPLALARSQAGGGSANDRGACQDSLLDFLNEMIRRRPRTDLADRARAQRIQMLLQCGNLQGALGDVRVALGRERGHEALAQLRILEARIRGTTSQDRSAAGSTFQQVASDAAGTGAAFDAKLRQAELLLQSGRWEAGRDTLTAIERASGATAPIKGRAMLRQAQALERQGQWADAVAVLRRIPLLYPNTNSAVESYLLMSRCYAARHEPERARQNLERATEYYSTAIKRTSGTAQERLIFIDYLVENYLALGQALQAAQYLEAKSPTWIGDSRPAALFKSAMLYGVVLGDTADSHRVLKKCIELFPETRYAEVARTMTARAADSNSGTR
jgi:tetratricopeptide (TPR) repeat protein